MTGITGTEDGCEPSRPRLSWLRRVAAACFLGVGVYTCISVGGAVDAHAEDPAAATAHSEPTAEQAPPGTVPVEASAAPETPVPTATATAGTPPLPAEPPPAGPAKTATVSTDPADAAVAAAPETAPPPEAEPLRTSAPPAVSTATASPSPTTAPATTALFTTPSITTPSIATPSTTIASTRTALATATASTPPSPTSTTGTMPATADTHDTGSPGTTDGTTPEGCTTLTAAGTDTFDASTPSPGAPCADEAAGAGEVLQPAVAAIQPGTADVVACAAVTGAGTGTPGSPEHSTGGQAPAGDWSSVADGEPTAPPAAAAVTAPRPVAIDGQGDAPAPPTSGSRPLAPETPPPYPAEPFTTVGGVGCTGQDAGDVSPRASAAATADVLGAPLERYLAVHGAAHTAPQAGSPTTTASDPAIRPD